MFFRYVKKYNKFFFNKSFLFSVFGWLAKFNILSILKFYLSNELSFYLRLHQAKRLGIPIFQDTKLF
jgi:hypothetical protein